VRDLRREVTMQHNIKMKLTHIKRKTDCVRNEKVLQRVKKERNIIRTIKRRKANWIGHILRGNFLLKQVIEGKDRRRGRSGGKTRKKI
jgi:hypothetical protein